MLELLMDLLKLVILQQLCYLPVHRQQQVNVCLLTIIYYYYYCNNFKTIIGLAF